MLMTLLEQLKTLRLTGMAETLQSRITEAREQSLSHQEWLSLCLQDELERRSAERMQRRLRQASFESDQTLEGYQLGHYPLTIQELVKDLQQGSYLQSQHHILVMGPTGTGKTHLAQGLGHHACRQGKKVKFIRAKKCLDALEASRMDHSLEKQMRCFLEVDLLILDDFGLQPLTSQQAADLYELIAEKHMKSSFIVTSNRPVEAWVELFPDPILGNAALDRLAHRAYHVILEGESYRRKTQPQFRLPKDVAPLPKG